MSQTLRRLAPLMLGWLLACCRLSGQTIYNPSFESNSFTLSPGYCAGNSSIAGWTASSTAQTGLNPASGNPFANNGAVPNGANVAFIQSTGGTNWLSTTISNLTAGTLYRVSCRANARTNYSLPQAWLLLGGALAYSNTLAPAGINGDTTSPYAYVYGLFTATSNSAPLSIGSAATTTNGFGTVDGALLVDNFQIAALTSNYFTVSPWTGDASAGVDSTNTLWAYSFGGNSSLVISGVTFGAAAGATPSAAGAFAVSATGTMHTYTGESPDYLSGSGSAALASDFIYGGSPELLTVSNLTAGNTYRLTLYGVGFDGQGNRYATFSSLGDSLYVDEDLYGLGNGMRVDYTFTASSATATATITPASSTSTFHLHGLALTAVPQRPRFTTQPPSLSLVAGSAGQLNVAVSGATPMSFQWFEQGVGALAGATNSTLAWSSLTATNAGSYYVVATNLFGSATSSNATVTVLFAPAITAQPTNIAAMAGTAAALSVTASGTQPLSYQWFETGVGALAGATNPALAWSALATTNAGSYYVVVSNALASTSSSNATVTVFGILVTSAPTNLAAFAGTPAQLSVQASGATALHYQWYRWNFQPVAGATNATLAWSSLAPSNGGAYCVVLTNSLDARTSSWVWVDPVLCHCAPLTNSPATSSYDPGLTFVTPVTAIAAGFRHCLALLADGSVVGWGDNYGADNSYCGQASAPASATNVVAVAAGAFHSLLLQANGSVIVWGEDNFGQANNPGLPNLTTIATGYNHNLAVNASGAVSTWGEPFYGLSSVPNAATNVVAVAGGEKHSLALRNDGSVLAWGSDLNDANAYIGQATVPNAATNVVAIAAGATHSLAARADGSVLGWGDNTLGQILVPAAATNAVGLAAGYGHSLALCSDGTVLGWGDNFQSEATIPAAATNAVAVGAGEMFSLVLRRDGSVLAWGNNYEGQTNVPSFGQTNSAASSTVTATVGVYSQTYYFTNLWGAVLTTNRAVYVQVPAPILQQDIVPLSGADVAGSQVTFASSIQGSPLQLQWYKSSSNGVTALAGATNSTLTLSNLATSDSAHYWLVGSNSGGSVSSSTNTFTVNAAATPSGGILVAQAYQTGAAGSLFSPTWTLSSNSLIAGAPPYDFAGDFTQENAGGLTILTDGQFGAVGNSTNSALATAGSNGGTCLVYQLTNVASGYSLTNIVVYGGWSDQGRDEQAYTIYYATSNAPNTFAKLASVDWLPSVSGSVPIATRVSLSASAGVLASNVAALKMDFTAPNNGGENGYEGYAEISLFGYASSPAYPTLTAPRLSATDIVFTLSANSGQTVVVESCTNLSAPTWVPVQTNLMGPTPIQFRAPIKAQLPACFYRLRIP